MARLWLANIEAGTTDDEIKAFLVKYGFPEFDKVEHVAAEGPRPAAIVTFDGVSADGLRTLQGRIHDLFWKKGRLVAQVLHDDFA